MFSLLGSSTQPGQVLSAYVSRSSREEQNDGMLQRFSMTVWPDGSENFDFIDQPINAVARDRAYTVFEQLDRITPASAQAQVSKELDISWLPFAPDAYAEFKPWRIDLEKRVRSGALGSPALESHLAKYRKLVPALALVRHLADGGTGPVSVEALRSAIAWSRYLESHARRIYGSMGEADLRAARAIIARIKQGDLAEPFLARELIRKGWAGLTDAVIAKNAHDLLEDAHWLSARSGRTGGRPLERYTINPKAKTASEA